MNASPTPTPPQQPAPPTQNPTKKWWKEAVAYQVWPKSFQDSDGDGIGDLNGLYQRLDHLQYLGIDVIWLSPMYRSPQDDNGYDVSDYQAIDPQFGTMEDFDRLLKEVHRRGMKLLVDLVVNHTSDEHAWFLESRQGKDSPKRDWYIWRDGARDPETGAQKEPSNWESIFGGSAWKLDPDTNQYFLHLFSAKQPDLNWENPAAREAVYQMMRWWLDKGIDGFRVDAISHMHKPDLSDMPNPQSLKHVPSYAKHMNVPGIHKYLREIKQETYGRYDVMTVGEANGVSAGQADDWVSEKTGVFNMLFQFEHLGLWNNNPAMRIDLPKVKDVFTRWQKGLAGKGWNALYLENHDIPRINSQWGNTDKYWRESSTSLATLYFLMQGTPFLYQGQEIGMTNTIFRGPEDFDDVRARNLFAQRRAEGVADSVTVAELSPGSRDNARTPMQWDASPQGGFTKNLPWLKVNPNFERINVAAQKGVAGSVLEHYRALVKLRKSDPLFVYGAYELLLPNHAQIYAYARELEGERAVVLCNLSGESAECMAAELGLNGEKAKLVNSNYEIGDTQAPARITLRPYEARVYR